MIVLKFGGTSVGSAQNIKKVASIVEAVKEDKIIVLSAVSGTTNSLVKINELINAGQHDNAANIVRDLQQQYTTLISDLYTSKSSFQKAGIFLNEQFTHLKNLMAHPGNENEILALGEIISTHLFHYYQQELNRNSELISALDFMVVDKHHEPIHQQISNQLTQILEQRPSTSYITQGFICRNIDGEIDNLKRGGSDYSASLIGAAIKASEIQIWTDISGMHNNDPRFVENTVSIQEISFDEAAELAYFGAKILHPQSIIPAQQNNIPVRLKNTFNPEAVGTIIKNCPVSKGIRAIAAKDDIIAIKIKSYRMLMAYGFLKKIFEVFEKYETAIDMITTSEVAVSLTIDNPTYLSEILKELEVFGKVACEHNMSIICLAGDFSQKSKGIIAQVTQCLKEIPIRMISCGGSNYNISLLVTSQDKVNALNLLNDGLFKAQNTPNPILN
ncbi:aspartate kinase [Flavobacteriaceae bacterium F08102]|nr:aspartate kinase [Flavobacteriaceae bacterium F08102]